MSNRISRFDMLMEVAHVVAKRGTCVRLQVGAVFAKEGRILVTGYNGAARGMAHCQHEVYRYGIDRMPSWYDKSLGEDVGHGVIKETIGTPYYFDGVTVSKDQGCTVAQHAERNAIDFAARLGISLEGSEVYVTHAPCEACAKSLAGVGVKEVYFFTKYRKTTGVEILVKSGIEVFDMGDTGMVV